uniref:Ig-like domain-containing protein n=1 Tax=Oreochromis aureus TaxID=47969 RepID=A0A668SK09_OREAU
FVPFWFLLFYTFSISLNRKVKTEVQAGPLYRVLGSPLYITCSVSGFRSENTDKHFEFRMTKPSNPNFEIQIISSNDDNFGYSNHQSRVRKNEIALKRLSPNSVRFEIKSLLKDDEGEYECTAVNLEGAYDGEYSAKTVVKVIEDSLSVSSSASTPLSLNEGEALTLTCLASSSTSQHTHLSVAWYLHKDGQEDAQPIISLNRDFTLSPGQGFERRYQAGLIRLDKLGEATYNLQIAKVEPSDRGRIYCQAQEWIQDPDGSWYIIIQKIAEEMTLTVKATVEISAQPAALQEGQELMLSCDINTQDVEKRFFSVAWLKGSVELARIGPTGVLTVEFMSRKVSVMRPTTDNFTLELDEVTLSDSGVYQCAVSERKPNGTASCSHFGATLNRKISRLDVSPIPALTRNMNTDITIKCSIVTKTSESSLYSITWLHEENAGNKTIVSLDRNSIVTESQTDLSQRISMRRSTGPTFELTIRQARISDKGSYTCKVGEWLQDPRGEWYLLSTVSKSTVLTITEPGEYIYFSYFRNMFTCHIQLAQN